MKPGVVDEAKTAAPPLAPEQAARLTDFARACKAAARAVLMYPSGHPAIATTLGRIVHITSRESLPGPLKIGVTPDALLLEGRAPARAEPAIAELAALLHQHLVGELTVHPGGDLESWRTFLLLLGRTPESVRADGGIARSWTTMAGRHIELREIDYAEMLRERPGDTPASWDVIITSCLQGDVFSPDAEAVDALLAIVGNGERLRELMASLEAKAGEAGGGTSLKAAAVVQMLGGIVEAVSKNQPDRLEQTLEDLAAGVSHLSLDVVLALLSHGAASAPEGSDDGGGGTPRLVDSVMQRMSPSTIAGFIARHVADNSAIERVAQAFQTLVKDGEERERLLALAHDDVARSPLGRTEGFEEIWSFVAQKLLTSYTDESYVSESYGRELSQARTQAVQVEQVGDDPPERVSAWLNTVATSALRALDLTLMLDLLCLEEDEERWNELMQPLVGLLEDLLLVGDFEAASQLVAVLVRQAAEDESLGRRQSASAALDRLVAGTMMQQLINHLATIGDAQFERVKTMCVSIGDMMVKPLAEALSVEENSRTRERLTAILLGFGASGRRTVERLKSSSNAAVRRTAVQLLRQFGGSEALPDLTELLADNEPEVQREAVRAILNLGTDRAYEVLKQALATGTARAQEAILDSAGVLRDEHVAPLFVYILRHLSHRGPLNGIYHRAIAMLGTLRDPEGIAVLKDTLYRGEWWAPHRTAKLRAAAAAALGRIGTPDALTVLEEAGRSRSRRIRAAVRVPLLGARARASREDWI